MQPKINEEWIPLQTKVFSRWVSRELNGLPNSNVQDVTKDLSNGVSLVELAEVLTHKRAPRLWDHKPTTKIENVQNCDLAIEMFERDGVKLVGISGKDVSDNNQKLILGLIWSLISHYSVGNSMIVNEGKINFDNDAKSNVNAQSELLSWAHHRVEKYSSVNESFEPFELFMCALIDSFYPDKIMFEKLDANDHQKNANLAFEVMKELNIPCFIYPEDLSKNEFKVDEMTFLTQLSAAKSVLDSNDIQKKGIEIAFSSPEELKIKNEEAKVRAELQREMEQKDQERQKELEEAKRKAEEAQKINAINQTRLRIQEVLQAKEKEERIKNEEAKVKAEEEHLAKIQEERLKAEEETRKRVEKEYRARVKEAELRAKSQNDEHLKSEIELRKKADEQSKLKNEAEFQVKLEKEARKKAELRAIEAEKENQILAQKLKEAELENLKMKHQNIDDTDNDDDHDQNHKEKHVRIKIKVHHKNEEDEHKKYKIGIKVKDHNKSNNVHHHLVCKNVRVIRNGKVVPSEIDEENVQNDGEKQHIHVKLL